jgi:hypothetical protein
MSGSRHEPHLAKPSCPGAPSFAEWDGATFALVRRMPGDCWRAGLFPDGRSERSMDVLAGSEARARWFVERWTAHHWRAIRTQSPRAVMPHEGLPPRKPKGSDERS